MKKFEVSVEVVRAFVVQVEANTAQEAAQKVEDMEVSEIDTDENYIDTHVVVDDEPEEAEE